MDDAPMGAKVNTMGGDIDIDNAKVYTDATTMGGDIDIRKIDGWLKASTMGGNVTAVIKVIDMSIFLPWVGILMSLCRLTFLLNLMFG